MPASASINRKRPSKKKSKASLDEIVPETSGKNEGVDLNWAYQPPPGAKAITANEDNGEFDWDAVKANDDVELWVIRVPDKIKPGHLEGLSLDLAAVTADSSKKRKRNTSRVGMLKRKHISYDIWSLGDEDTHPHHAEEQLSHPVVGGEELRSLTCLLPRRSKKGELYPAPKPIARHLIVSAQPPTTSEGFSVPYENPLRHKYPQELLTHRFMPYGSLVNINIVLPSPDSAQTLPVMEVDISIPEAEVGEKEPRKTRKKKKSKPEKVNEEAEALDEVVKDVQVEPKVEKEKKKSRKRKDEDQEEVGGLRKSKKAKMS